MAWNQQARSPMQKLHATGNWEAKGLAHWQQRLARCDLAVRQADSGTELRRAIEQREIAATAVRRLQEG